MSILSNNQLREMLKRFATYKMFKLISEAPGYDKNSKAFALLALEENRAEYLTSFEYLDQLSDNDRLDIFNYRDPESTLEAMERYNMETAGESGDEKPISLTMQQSIELWQADYERYKAGEFDEDVESSRKKTRSAPRPKPKDLFPVHSSAPVYDIGETIARGNFGVEALEGRFPSAEIIGGTTGRIELLPFWDHKSNQPLTPQSISLLTSTDTSQFRHMQEEALRIATSYNEEMATYFYAMDAYWLTNAKNENDFVELNIADLLQYTGKKPVKTHGRYTSTFRPEQLRRAGLMVYGMGFSMVEIERAIVKGVGERLHYKRLWDVSDMYILKTLDGESYTESITYRPNELFRGLSFGTRRETALLMSKVLSLDYEKMVVARRLGRYFTWLWRDRAYHGNIADAITCAKLMDRCGIEVEKGRERYARRSLETALDRLEIEGIISQWVLLDRDGAPADTSGRISFNRWLEMKISVSPPDTILMHYASRMPLKPEDKDNPLLDVAKLKQERKRLGYTLAMLSEETGVELSTLSRIMAGKTKRPRNEHVQSLNRWLSSLTPEKE